jgi:two-component system invasion response regulator UvrY
MLNLLLVDDHYIIRTGFKLVIESFIPLCNIDEAYDGNSAFEKIKHHDYDLIIMDVNMPNTDSFGIVSTVLSYKPGSKIIMFSMNSEDIYAERYLKMGTMGYIRKDAPEIEIKKAINTVLNNKRYISPELSEKLLTGLQINRKGENPFDTLSPREFEIVQHLIKGESVAEISHQLNIHTSTVGTHKARIFEKLRCSNIIDLNKLAKVHNLIFSE